ncbi:MAG: sugar phosphate isomerase/epimerase family protein [Armatimonadota bacterium]
MIDRRTLISAGTAGALATALAPHAEAAAPEQPIPAQYATNGYFIGCQAWTWNHFTALEAVEKTAQAGGKVIEFFPGQKVGGPHGDTGLGPDCAPEVIATVKAALAKHGLKAVNFGVVGIPNNAAGARKLFEFAKTMGLRAITTESVDAIDTFEPLVMEFDICVAFHNHPRQPNNPNYKVWDPNYILSVVKGRDKRIGACADTGHWVRSGLKPVDCIRILKGHIISSHLKDLNAFEPEAHDVPFGTGVSDIPGILDEYRRQGFTGNISVEYEHEMDKSMPMVAQCIGFVRGYSSPRGK